MCSFSFLEKCSRLLLAQQAQPGCCCWLCPLYSRCPALAPWRYKLWVFGAIPAAGSAMFWSSGCSGACWVSTCHLVLLSLPSCCQCSLLWPCAHSSAVLCALITVQMPPWKTCHHQLHPTPPEHETPYLSYLQCCGYLIIPTALFIRACSPCLSGAWGGGAQLGGCVQLSCVCFCFQHKGSGCRLNALWICFLRHRRSKQGLGRWPFIRHFVRCVQDSITYTTHGLTNELP